MPQEAIVILDSNIGKSALPNFARKSPFDKLYGRLDGNFFINRDQQMDVVIHQDVGM